MPRWYLFLGTNNSGNFIKATQTGLKYWFATWGTMASGNAGTNPWVAVDLTPANMTTNAAFVPSVVSTHAFGSIFGIGRAGITNDSTVANGITAAPNKIMVDNGADSGHILWELNIITTDTVYWISDNAGANLYLAGFELNKII